MEEVVLFYNGSTENGAEMSKYLKVNLSAINKKVKIHFVDIAYDKNIDTARRRGIVQTPTLIMGKQTYVGNKQVRDRLEYICHSGGGGSNHASTQKHTARYEDDEDDKYNNNSRLPSDDEEDPDSDKSKSFHNAISDFTKRRAESLSKYDGYREPEFDTKQSKRAGGGGRAASTSSAGGGGGRKKRETIQPPSQAIFDDDSKFIEASKKDEYDYNQDNIPDDENGDLTLENYWNELADEAGRKHTGKGLKMRR